MKNIPIIHFLKIFIGICLVSTLGCHNQSDLSTKHWYKGNLHTHSYWSDGDEFPEVIMDYYKSRDYQFVALSDHNTLAEGEKWKTIPKDSIYQIAFQNYLNKYGREWVNYLSDSSHQLQVKLKTYPEYKSQFEEKEKFLIIQSEEITDQFQNKPLHMNATNIQKKIDPQGGKSVVEVLQNNIDAVISQRDQTHAPMFVHVNHPNFGYAIGLEDMIALKNERFFEVYNGHHSVHNAGDSMHMSTETMWDLINRAYILDHKPLIYGLATDDSHHYHLRGSMWSNAGRGWVMVRADSLHPRSLIQALEAGEFYASTGIELREMTFKNNQITVEVKTEPGITYIISFLGCKKGKSEPEEFWSVQADKASFTLNKDHLFVRCKITSSKLHENPIENLLFETAWTQPMQANP